MLNSDVELSKPVPLRPDNFTPLTRTPWAGAVITSQYKEVVVPGAVGARVGEAWEFSCDSQFPSVLQSQTLTLPELVKANPDAILGPHTSEVSGFCEILVKIINAAHPLSLQIHPTDDDPDLGAGACGKPESWYILQADPGAGIFLGYNRSLQREELHGLLKQGDKAKDVLQFVHVHPGDYFEIEPGVPHAIGGGVTLLEPQRIRAGKSGITFRMWDWGRLYNKQGELDMRNGQPRALHLEESIKLTDPMRQVGQKFVDSCRRTAYHQRVNASQWTSFPANPYYQLHIVDTAAGDDISMVIRQGYGALVMLNGKFTAGSISLEKGHSALLPFECFPFDAHLSPLTKLAVVVPAGAGFKVV